MVGELSRERVGKLRMIQASFDINRKAYPAENTAYLIRLTADQNESSIDDVVEALTIFNT